MHLAEETNGGIPSADQATREVRELWQKASDNIANNLAKETERIPSSHKTVNKMEQVQEINSYQEIQGNFTRQGEPAEKAWH
jgi:hypothetical protein